MDLVFIDGDQSRQRVGKDTDLAATARLRAGNRPRAR
jgi:hypothetical protein